MKKLFTALIVSAVAVAGTTTAIAAKPPKPGMVTGAAKALKQQKGSGKGVVCVRNTRLRAANEVPPSTSTAKGHAQIKVRRDGSIQYKIFVLNRGGETFAAGHIHEAPAGIAGPVRVGLFAGPATDARHIRLSGTVTATADLAADICADPDDYYVNLHTTVNTGGAIRGQLG